MWNYEKRLQYPINITQPNAKNGKALKLTWTADANTINALKAYQESRKEVLEVDGICGSATWKDLIAI